MKILWTEEDDALLRSLWASQGSACASYFPGRTLASIRNRAKKLKLSRVGYTWTPEEDAIIKQYYFSEGKSIVARLPGRTLNTIYARAQQLGVQRDTTPETFTEMERDIIKKWYHQDKEKMYRLLPKHTKKGCKREARTLGLLKDFDGTPWTAEEEQYLREHYPTEGTSCFSHFTERTWSSVNGKVRNLGLLIDDEHQRQAILNSAPWTPEQDAILRAYYPVEGGACYTRVPPHTANACRCRARNLGITYDCDRHVLPTGEIKVRQGNNASEFLETGMTKGRLTLIEPMPGRATDGSILWRCVCTCGKEAVVSSHNLRNGVTQSCGCIRSEAQGKVLKQFMATDAGKAVRERSEKELPFRTGMFEGTNASSLLSGYVRKDNPTGVRGVSKTRSGRFIAQIRYKGVRYNLGTYDTLDEAAVARKRAEDIIRPELERIMGDASDALKELRKSLISKRAKSIQSESNTPK